MIGSRLGFLQFLLLRNDKLWDKLTKEEKEIVLKNNLRHNNYRPDYAEPEKYQDGKSFASPRDSVIDVKERTLNNFLRAYKPKSVLEIGPGSGYLTFNVVDAPSVEHYVGIDINNAFLEFLRPFLEEKTSQKSKFEFTLVNSDINSAEIGEKEFDAILLFSAVHHIPDRLALFNRLSALLSKRGRLLIIEPAHYIPRKLFLLKKYFAYYIKSDHWAKDGNYGTHHFCTLEEFQVITESSATLEISQCHYFMINFPFPRVIKRGFGLTMKVLGYRPERDGTFSTEKRKSWLRFFADQIAVVFKKKNR